MKSKARNRFCFPHVYFIVWANYWFASTTENDVTTTFMTVGQRWREQSLKEKTGKGSWRKWEEKNLWTGHLSFWSYITIVQTSIEDSAVFLFLFSSFFFRSLGYMTHSLSGKGRGEIIIMKLGSNTSVNTEYGGTWRTTHKTYTHTEKHFLLRRSFCTTPDTS
jgi:hypothetical protein